MIYKELKNVKKPVSQIFFGTAGEGFRTGKDQKELLDAIYATGINAFDTGRVYGESEKILGDWLDSRGLYDKVVILSKCAHPTIPLMKKRVSEKEIRKDYQESVKNLKTDYIDIYLLHRDDPDVPAGTIVEIMNALYAEGKIGAFGGSNWTHHRIEEANEYAYKHNLVPFTVSSPNFSLAHQVKDPWGGGCTTLTGEENAEARVWYEKNQMPVIAYSSLANGLFSGRVSAAEPKKLYKGMCREAVKGFGYPENIERVLRCEALAKEKNCSVSQIALAWMYHQKLDVFAIVSTSSAVRMEENIQALNIKLTEQECKYLNLETN